MNSPHNFSRSYFHFATGILIVLCPTLLFAQNNKKDNSTPPPKAAAPAKPAAAPAKPSGASGAAGALSTAGGTRPAANAGAHAGPMANGPRKTVPGNPPPPAYPQSTKTPVTPVRTPVVPPPPKVGPKNPPNGGSGAQRRPNGQAKDIHVANHNMDIHHNLGGGTRVSAVRPDGSRIVAQSGRLGYIQRGYSHNGHAYTQRTFYSGGRTYAAYYRGYNYRGVDMLVYDPAFYYSPEFYGWAYSPWYSSVAYGWGWMGDPWFSFYDFYFTPYGAYPSASLWLTDYMISSDLQTQYQARQAQPQDDQQSSAAAAPLTPEVKQMIADEVKAEISQENAEAKRNAQNQEPTPDSSSIAVLFSDNRAHVFVVGDPLDVHNASGAECALSDGDVLNMAAPPASGTTTANLIVLSSKGGNECRKFDMVAIALADLQEMQNHMRQTIDQGLRELQTKQGTGGLPAAPAAATAPPANAAVASDAPPPDPNGAAEVNQELADASQAEQQMLDPSRQRSGSVGPTPVPAASPAPTSSPSPATVRAGQSMDEVKAILGNPITVIDLGSKVTYKYPGMKIIFQDGKVWDVE